MNNHGRQKMVPAVIKQEQKQKIRISTEYNRKMLLNHRGNASNNAYSPVTPITKERALMIRNGNDNEIRRERNR